MLVLTTCWQVVLTFFIHEIMKAATASTKNSKQLQQCIGKHQIPLEASHKCDLATKIDEGMDFTNFNMLPESTILENNGYTITINFKYDSRNGPTIIFDAKQYRFAFLYFQWFENFSTTTLPFELHAVFYNKELKTLENALKKENNVVVLAFGVQERHALTAEYVDLNLKNYIKYVRNNLTKISIENHPLKVWLPLYLDSYIMYEGYLPLFNCEAQVLWVDFLNNMSFEPDLMKEFKIFYKNGDGKGLMWKHKSFQAPTGPLVLCKANEIEVLFESIPFVDAYDYDYAYDDNIVPRNGTSNILVPKYIWKLSVLMIFLKNINYEKI